MTPNDAAAARRASRPAPYWLVGSSDPRRHALRISLASAASRRGQCRRAQVLSGRSCSWRENWHRVPHQAPIDGQRGNAPATDLSTASGLPAQRPLSPPRGSSSKQRSSGCTNNLTGAEAILFRRCLVTAASNAQRTKRRCRCPQAVEPEGPFIDPMQGSRHKKFKTVTCGSLIRGRIGWTAKLLPSYPSRASGSALKKTNQCETSAT